MSSVEVTVLCNCSVQCNDAFTRSAWLRLRGIVPHKCLYSNIQRHFFVFFVTKIVFTRTIAFKIRYPYVNVLSNISFIPQSPFHCIIIFFWRAWGLGSLLSFSMIGQNHFHFDKGCYMEIKTCHVFHKTFVIVVSCWNWKKCNLIVVLWIEIILY